MSEDYRLRAILSADDQGMASALDEVYQKTGTLADRLKGGIGFGAMAKIGSAAISTVAGGISSFANDMMTAGNNFTASMSQVSAISGATGKDLAALTAKAKEMGATTKFTASEAADAQMYMAMAGWKTQDMLDGLEGIMNLAAAAGEDLATTSDIVTDALTAFGLSASESGHFADVLAAASSNANTNVSLLGESFKYVAPVAGSLGYKAEDVSVALGLMANAGLKGSQAGTALRTTITNLAKPTDEMAGAMETLGLSLTDSNGQMKSLDSVMGDLRKAFSNLTADQKASYAATLAGKEGMSGLLAIVNATETDYKKLSQAIANCDGVSKEMADTMQNNLTGKMTILGSAMEGLGIAAYDHVKEPFSDAVETITDKVGDLTKEMESGKLAGIMDGIGKAAKKGAKVAAGAIDMLIDHGEDLIEVGTGIAATWAVIKIGPSLAKDFRTASSAISRFSGLAQTGFKRTDALLGALEGGSGALSKFASNALTAGGGLKGMASAAVSLINPTTACIAAVGAVAGGITYWIVKNRDLFDSNKEVRQSVQELRDSYGECTEKLADSKKAREESVEAATIEAAQAEILAGKIETLAAKENKSAGEKAYLASMVDELNNLIPELNLQYDAEADKLNATTEAINDKIAAMKQEAEVAAWKEAQVSITQDLAEATREQYKATETLGDLQTKEAEAAQKYQKAHSEWLAAGTSATDEQSAAMAVAAEEWNGCKEAVKEAQKVVEDYDAQIKSLNDEFETFGAKQQQMTAKEGWENLIAEAEKAGVEIPQALKDAIDNGAMMVPESIEQLKSLIEWNSLAQEAEKAGVEIPTKLAEGIKAGTVDPAAAVAQMNDLLSPEYQHAIDRAQTYGVEIPTKLAEGIRSGETQPKEAIDYINAMINDYQPALQAAQAAGVAIPGYIAAGLQDGATTVQEATDTLKSLVVWNDLVTAAEAAGVNIPATMSASISTGAITVQEACAQVMALASGSLDDPAAGETSGQDIINAYNAALAGGQSGAEAAAALVAASASKELQKPSDYTNAGKAGGQTYAKGVSGMASQAGTAGTQLKTSATQKADASKEMQSKGKTGGQNYAQGVSSMASQAGSAGTKIKTTAVNATAGGYQSAYSNGTMVTAGFAAGMESLLGRVQSAASQMVDAASKATKAKALIASPSKLFKRFGSFVGSGFAIGIESQQKAVAAAAASLVNIPAVDIPSLAVSSGDSMGLDGSAATTIVVPVELDGWAIAKASAKYMRDCTATLDQRDNRIKGGR